jgi:hypothetical protein
MRLRRNAATVSVPVSEQREGTRAKDCERADNHRARRVMHVGQMAHWCYAKEAFPQEKGRVWYSALLLFGQAQDL